MRVHRPQRSGLCDRPSARGAARGRAGGDDGPGTRRRPSPRHRGEGRGRRDRGLQPGRRRGRRRGVGDAAPPSCCTACTRRTSTPGSASSGRTWRPPSTTRGRCSDSTPGSRGPTSSCSHDRLYAAVPEVFDAPTALAPPASLQHTGFLVPPADPSDRPPELGGPDEHAVLVSLSTTDMGQGPLLQTILDALDGQEVRALVTVGCRAPPRWASRPVQRRRARPRAARRRPPARRRRRHPCGPGDRGCLAEPRGAHGLHAHLPRPAARRGARSRGRGRRDRARRRGHAGERAGRRGEGAHRRPLSRRGRTVSRSRAPRRAGRPPSLRTWRRCAAEQNSAALTQGGAASFSRSRRGRPART